MAETPSTRKYLFFSDAHLGGFSEQQNRNLEQELIHLVEYCRVNEYRICILGDLFDYWMEYPDQVPGLGKTLLKHFKRYNEQFGPTLFITGNHDNWTRGYFASVGFDVESEYRKIPVADGRHLLLLHGDGLSDRSFNLPRPLLHRLLRNDTFVRLFQRIFPPRTGIKLMQKFSQFTRSYEENTREQKKLDRWAKQYLKSREADVIICGHDHQPRRYDFSYGTFLNLGTFYRNRTVAVYNKGQFSLVVWNDKAQELEHYHHSGI